MCAGGHIGFRWVPYYENTNDGEWHDDDRLKFLKLNFLSRQRGYADLEVQSDKCLKDIGFRLARRDLSSVKPFWLA